MLRDTAESGCSYVMALRRLTGVVFVLKVLFRLFFIRRLVLLSTQPQFLSNSDVSVPL